MSLFESASLVVTPNGTKASKLYAIKPTSGAGDLTVVRATTATRVNSAGLIESVAVNVPRLDYTNSTCPSILVEPQRTNICLRSQEIGTSPWDINGNVNFSSSSVVDPSGLTNAKKATNTLENGAVAFFQLVTTSTNTYTYSIYVKKDTNRYFGLILTSGATGGNRYGAYFDLENGTLKQVFNTAIPLTNTSNKIENAGNGWYRCSITATCNSLVYIVSQSTNNGTIILNPLTGDLVNATTGIVNVWGAQVEAGSYATSYIPTVASTVTRNADVISKTGISSLIGQTEGTLFCEINTQQSTTNNWFQILDGTAANWIFIGLNGTKLVCYIRLSSTTYIFDQSFVLTSGVSYKLALGYKSGDSAFYINGTQIATLGSGFAASNPLSQVIIGDLTAAPNESVKYKEAVIWKTRLTNAELAELTTI